MFSNIPSKQERNDINFTTEVVNHLLPDQSTRKLCLDIFANSIITANKLNRKKWTISLRPNGINTIRLNLGMIYVCDIREESMVFTLFAPNLSAINNYLVLPPDDPKFVSLPEATWCWFEAKDLSIIWPHIQVNYNYLLSVAAKTNLNGGSSKAHSPGVIKYLQQHTNSSVPHRL